ncbi:hypothetical protein BP6252_07576 [Coleophoma cylindrospora]|uniref:Zn(2)-C6 fungal-type domain-containing protein n=1 Tax=Coleophoma cylindrospora TaxID=1849047 RepID=A0A3D8RAD3_9HELO|nr:hypothetical protein BP6252_07576 [Coleophoma cylindrospora]
MPKGCGTCRDRKVSCDRTAPRCRRCIVSSRACQGYGIRLSWPKVKVHRRAILGSSSKQEIAAPMVSTAWVISASTWDIEMHHYMSDLGLKDRRRLVPPVMPRPISWSPIKLDTQGSDLLHYFEQVASYSLATYGYRAADVREILMRIALTDDTASTRAVMLSILAVASIHRFGPQAQAIQYKTSSIQALSASLRSDMGMAESVQHVAAGMLLCTFETQQAAETSGLWLCYLCGVKDIINANDLSEKSTPDSDVFALLGWVYYHDTLSTFSIRHWRRHATIGDAYIKEVGVELARSRTADCKETKIPGLMPLSHQILCLLKQPCHTLLEPSDPQHGTESHESYLRSLQWKLMRIPIPNIADEPFQVHSHTEAAENVDMELYRLASLVYLARIAGPLLQNKGGVHKFIERAFVLFSRLGIYRRPFPLLIFGLEARTDNRRIALLDLITETENTTPVRNLGVVKSMIQSIWVQDDLAREEIEYRDRLNVTISSSENLPTFA